jgi:hypothetical protein
MPYADKEKQKEYQRNYQRMKRAGEREVKRQKKKPLTIEEIATAAGIRDLLAETIREVKAAKLDTVVRARCIGYLAGVALKAIEVSDLETRISILEEGANINH